MAEVVAIAEKMSRSERYAQLKDEVTAQLAEEAGENAGQITSFLDSLRKKVMRSQIVEEGTHGQLLQRKGVYAQLQQQGDAISA